MKSVFQGRDLLAIEDYSKEEIMYLIEFAEHLKYLKKNHIPHRYLEGKNIALIFEKPSTRTRAAFTTAAIDLGAHPEYLGKGDIQLGKKESVRDTALVLASMFDGIEYRGFEQQFVEELAECSEVPVWNGLTNQSHPTQMLADYMTIKEEFGKLEGLTLAYMGTGDNNVCNSLIITGAILGVNVTVGCPEELKPRDEVLEKAYKLAEKSGAKIRVTSDPVDAVTDADAIYTNVWAAMHEEAIFEQRVKLNRPYQVNAELLSHVKNPNYILLHCLPAFHNRETELGEQIYEKYGLAEMEMTDEVFYGVHARQFEEAENRMHTIKAIMAATLGNLFIPQV